MQKKTTSKSNKKISKPKVQKIQKTLAPKITPEKTFIILAFIFGLLFTFINPPFQVGDEIAHFYRIYELSEAKIVSKKINNTAGDYIPKDLISMTKDLEGGKHFKPQKDFFNHKLKKYINKKTDFSTKRFADFRNTVLYSPVVYLPQVAGVSIAKAINFSPLLMLYLGRLFNLLAFIAMAHLAIKITPIYKWGFTLFALMPTTLYQAASLSADSVCFGLCFLFTAFILNCALSKDKFITNKKLTLIFIMSILLVLCKSAYFFMIFLFFLIPVKKFGTKKKYFSTILTITAVTAIFSILWALTAKLIYVPFFSWANPDAQMMFVFNHPIKFLEAILEFFNYIYTDTLTSFVGNFGRELDTPLPDWLILAFFNVIIATAIFENYQKITIDFKQKCIVIMTLLLNIISIDFLLYLSCNRVGDNYIDGLLGRYFIPIAPLFLLPFYNQFAAKLDLINKGGNVFLAGFSTITLSISAYYIITRYYLLF